MPQPLHTIAAVGLLLGACFTGRASGPGEPPPSSEDGPQALELTELPPVTTNNPATLIAVDRLTVRTSSTFDGWPPANATDGNLETSWYSDRDDSAARGGAPFYEIEFARPTTVRRVTILGNRDPSFLRGYTIRKGRLEIWDADGRVLLTQASAGTGNRRDFDFRLVRPIEHVKIVRFTSIADEGDKNQYGDVAIAEFQIE